MPRRTLGLLLACVSVAAIAGCYAQSAMRRSDRIVRGGFDFDAHGPWVLVTAPGSLLLAGGNLAVGSLIPLGGGVDPRAPAYASTLDYHLNDDEFRVRLGEFKEKGFSSVKIKVGHKAFFLRK